MIDQQQLPNQEQLCNQQVSTVDEINETIAAHRQHYIAAYFAGHDGEAQFYVYEIARLENLRNIVQRQALAS